MRTKIKHKDKEDNNLMLVGLGLLLLALVYVFTYSNVNVSVFDTEQLSQTPLQINNNSIIQNNLFGVPIDYTEQTKNTKRYNLIKGQLNKMDIRARIGNEHAESSRQVQAIVNQTTIVTQHFRASNDNIDGLYLTLESADNMVIDNFETYANSLSLQSVWVATGNIATLETNIVKTGLQSMALSGDIINNQWIKTLVIPFDYTGYTGSFDAQFTKDFNKFKVSVFIQDTTGNKKSFQLIFNNKDVWNHYDILESTMIEDPLNTLPTDTTQINRIGFNIDDPDGGEFAYIDNILATTPAGSINIELWNMGTTEPINTITSISDGTQYTKLNKNMKNVSLDLLGGKRMYHLHDMFNAGVYKNEPTNELLNKDNYYMLVLSYIDTPVLVYGVDTSFNIDYYKHGFASTTPDKTTPITQINPYSDIMFAVQSMQDIYVTEVEYRFNNQPNGFSDLYIFLEDTNMSVTNVVADHEESPQQNTHEEINIRPMFLEDGGKTEFYYNDDYTDSVTEVVIGMTFLYKKPFVWG